MSPSISIIIPTYNSSVNFSFLLESLIHSRFRDFEVIVNDALSSHDTLSAVIERFRDHFPLLMLRENISMAQARKRASEYAKGEILFHIDADMRVTPWLLGAVYETMRSYDALVVREVSFGTSFWARCKWLEKECYSWIESIESCRVIRKSVYDSLWWHDASMVFSEDKDLDLRIRAWGYRVWRVDQEFLWHNEGNLSLFSSIRKKSFYANTANIFKEKHLHAYRTQMNIVSRSMIFLRNGKYLFRHPLLSIGLFIMKTGEYCWGSWGILRNRIKP